MKTNQELLEEANKIDFKLNKQGNVNYHKHNAYERGLFLVKQAIEVHGIDKYRYGLVPEAYINSGTKVPVICIDHGKFMTLPTNHVGKCSGCPKCNGGSVRMSQEEFEAKARSIHGDKYSYDKSIYKGSDVKVIITCPTHGDFEQVPHNHLHGQGCPRCTKTFNTEDFIQKASLVHRRYYTYNRSVYINYMCKVVITCPTHGDFSQLPSAHMRGSGCPKCANKAIGDKLRSNIQEFVDKAASVHNNRYDYKNAVYKGNREKLEIICPIHGSFWQTPSSHLNFQGCPKCKGKNHNILYLLRCSTTGLHKIGITTDNVAKRMSGIGGNLEEVFHVVCEDPGEHETHLHRLYKEFNVYHDRVNNGNTEFFSLNKEQVKQIIDYMSSIAIN